MLRNMRHSEQTTTGYGPWATSGEHWLADSVSGHICTTAYFAVSPGMRKSWVAPADLWCSRDALRLRVSHMVRRNEVHRVPRQEFGCRRVPGQVDLSSRRRRFVQAQGAAPDPAGVPCGHEGQARRRAAGRAAGGVHQLPVRRARGRATHAGPLPRHRARAGKVPSLAPSPPSGTLAAGLVSGSKANKAGGFVSSSSSR